MNPAYAILVIARFIPEWAYGRNALIKFTFAYLFINSLARGSSK